MTQVRNFGSHTTGDFYEFDYLVREEWLPARISRTAIDVLAQNDLRPAAQIFAMHREAIGRAIIDKPIDPSHGVPILCDGDITP
jgi:hypothetical protein